MRETGSNRGSLLSRIKEELRVMREFGPDIIRVPLQPYSLHRDGSGKVDVGMLLAASVYTMIAAVIIREGFAHLSDMEAWFARTVPSIGLRRVIGVIAMANIALLLFRLKRARIRVYALLEIAFALASGWIATGLIVDPKVDLRGWAGLATAGYLVVRGLDNYTKGTEAMTANVVDPTPVKSGDLPISRISAPTLKS